MLTRCGLALRALLALGVLACGSVAHAGAWVPDPGHFYLELRGLFITTAQGFDTRGARRTLRADSPLGAVPARLRDGQAILYGEVGLATRLAVVADLAVLRSVTLARDGTSNLSAVGVGDLHAGLRLVLLDEEVTCAIEARLGIPTGRSDGAVPLGPGDLRGELVLHLGHVWERVPFFVQLALGAELRSSGTQRIDVSVVPQGASRTVSVDYAPALVYAAEVGYLARTTGGRVRFSPVVRIDGQHGTRAPSANAPASADVDPVAPASMRYLRVSAQVSAELRPSRRRPDAVIVSAGGGAFVWGQGLPAAAQVSLALGYRH